MNLSNQVILFDGVNMPLVDSEDIVFDSSLSKSINERFTISKSGHITDDKGNLWMVWSLVELERWWNIFESAVGIPFGRKLFNSCCDEEEFQISDTGLFVKRLFRKKKNRNNLLNRWDNCGWGKIDIKIKKSTHYYLRQLQQVLLLLLWNQFMKNVSNLSGDREVY